MSGSVATYPRRNALTIGVARCSSSIPETDAEHHVGQREDDDVRVRGGEQDGERGDPERQAGARGSAAVRRPSGAAALSRRAVH